MSRAPSSSADDRRRRLAEALRLNLRRRKARERVAAPEQPAEGAEARTGPEGRGDPVP